MSEKNDFNSGSKYNETIEKIVKFAKLEIKILDDDFSEGYEKFKEKHLLKVNVPTSCYKCLMLIDGKSMVIEEQVNRISYFKYYFHEKCFDEMIKKQKSL